MRDRRPTRRPAALLAGVTALALLVLLVPAAIAEAREPVGGQDRHGSYAGSHGRLDYQVHLPPSWRADRAMPVVVAVHGCGMTGSGPRSDGLFADRAGPDLSAAVWEFASARPMG